MRKYLQWHKILPLQKTLWILKIFKPFFYRFTINVLRFLAQPLSWIIKFLVSVSFIIVANQMLNIYPSHAKVPFLYPPENVRKTMMFSGGKEKQHWRALGTSITVTTTDTFFSCSPLNNVKHSEASMKQADDSPKSSELLHTHKISKKVSFSLLLTRFQQFL